LHLVGLVSVLLNVFVASAFVWFYQSILPYILESNPHRFYSFRGLKNQMRIKIACVENWILKKNDRADVRAMRSTQ